MNTHGTTTSLHAITGKTYTKVVPYDMDGYVATGEVTTLEFEGGWDECLAEAAARVALGTTSCQVTVTVTGDAAGMAKLTVSSAVYVPEPSDSEEEEPGEGEDPGEDEEEEEQEQTAGTAGKSENNPSYTFEVTSIAASILLHPTVQKWMQGASTAEKSAAQAIANGASAEDWISLNSSGKVTRSKISDILANSSILSFLQSNPPQYFTFSATVRATYQVSASTVTSDISGIGKIAKPPGPFGNATLGDDRNFLYIGSSYQTVGKITTCTKTYLMSEAGGWSKDLYS